MTYNRMWMEMNEEGIAGENWEQNIYTQDIDVLINCEIDVAGAVED